MEYGGSKEDANTATVAKVKLEHDTTTKELKEETKCAMDIVGVHLSQDEDGRLQVIRYS